MRRRGQCRCGNLLIFEKGPEGYKGRCPRCGAVVRVRGKGRKKRRVPRAPLDPLGLLDLPTVPPSQRSPPPEILSVPSEPEMTLVPWTEPPVPAPRAVNTWLIVGGVAVVVLAIGGVIGWFLF